MYKDLYGTDYVFIPKNPNPYGAKECKDSWSLLAAFNGNAHDVRKYIYWLFTKGINKNTTITSFGYTTTPAIIRKYNLYLQKKNILDRSSKLPKIFIDWCRTYVPNIFDRYALDTMNDLGALIAHVNAYKNEILSDSDEYRLLSVAESHNLVKNGRLNIGKQ